jgi:hypothetical protein
VADASAAAQNGETNLAAADKNVRATSARVQLKLTHAFTAARP